MRVRVVCILGLTLAGLTSGGSLLASDLEGELGSLTLETEPLTRVLWDGVVLGSTDARGRMIIAEIPPGSYTLRLRKQGFEEATRRLEITAGPRILVIELTAQHRAPSRSFAEPAGPSEQASPPVALEVSEPPTAVPLVPLEVEVAAPEPAAEVEPAAEPPAVSDDTSSEVATVAAGALDRGASPLGIGLFVALLAGVAGGALWLGHRRSRAGKTAVETAGPRVVMAEPGAMGRRTPDFYDDLRRRETALDNFEETGPDRYRRRVIDLSSDHRPGEKG